MYREDILKYNNEQIINSNAYKMFIKNNPSVGYLNIRAFAANRAIPISGLKIIVSKEINNYKVVFYEGYTDNSGIINAITLPAPTSDKDDLIAPNMEKYDVEAIYDKNKTDLHFVVNIYSNIQVIQDINIIPENRMFMGVNYGG